MITGQGEVRQSDRLKERKGLITRNVKGDEKSKDVNYFRTRTYQDGIDIERVSIIPRVLDF